MTRTIKFLTNKLPFFIAILAFVLMVLGAFNYSSYKRGQWEKDIRSKLLETLIAKKSKLEKALYSRIYYTRGVAAFVSLNPNISEEEYYHLADEYIKNDSVISTMALSPNCILAAVYPLKGHEPAIGLNLLEHPERKEIVEKTIETHKTFVAGPVELVEGGIAFISYTPIFNSLNDNEFWGVTDIVIYRDKLFNEAGLATEEGEFRFGLKGYNGQGANGAFFWGDESVFSKNPVATDIELPYGTWSLAAVPVSGWEAYVDQDMVLNYILFISSLIISILIWLFTRAVVKLKKREQELNAIFASMDNLIVEFNAKGEYVKIPPTNDELLFKPAKELIGKTVYEIFDKEKAKFFHDSIEECLQKKELVVIEYPLKVNNVEHWFAARISYKTNDTVIFNAYDITEKKASEIELKELNSMKDRFFSIIAHDLRNPLGSFKTLTDLLITNYDDITDEERISMLKNMQDATTSLFDLLENLLAWARSQQGQLKMDTNISSVEDLIKNVIPPFISYARLKNIEIISDIPKNLNACFDPDMTKTVIRNILSNAIKFTPEGGQIQISASEIKEQDKPYVKINITDNGVGIPHDVLEKLFRLDTSISTKGTNNEEGSGLGLVLCKEFIEKQKGEIYIKSELNKGTSVSFTLSMSC